MTHFEMLKLRKENLKEQIRELNDSDKSFEEKRKQMILLDGLMEDIEKEESMYDLVLNGED